MSFAIKDFFIEFYMKKSLSVSFDKYRVTLLP